MGWETKSDTDSCALSTTYNNPHVWSPSTHVRMAYSEHISTLSESITPRSMLVKIFKYSESSPIPLWGRGRNLVISKLLLQFCSSWNMSRELSSYREIEKCLVCAVSSLTIPRRWYAQQLINCNDCVSLDGQTVNFKYKQPGHFKIASIVSALLLLPFSHFANCPVSCRREKFESAVSSCGDTSTRALDKSQINHKRTDFTPSG